MYAVSVNLKKVTARFGPSYAFFKPRVMIFTLQITMSASNEVHKGRCCCCCCCCKSL